MAGCPRVNYVRRCHYATRSNRVKMIRTPGNRLVAQRRDKRSQGIHTPWVLGHKRLGGTKALTHIKLRTAPKYGKTVSRAYGGVLSHDQVKDRVTRAFLVEEQRIVKRVLAAEAKYKRSKARKETSSKRKVEKKAAIKKRAVSGKVGTKKVQKK